MLFSNWWMHWPWIPCSHSWAILFIPNFLSLPFILSFPLGRIIHQYWEMRATDDVFNKWIWMNLEWMTWFESTRKETPQGLQDSSSHWRVTFSNNKTGDFWSLVVPPFLLFLFRNWSYKRRHQHWITDPSLIYFYCLFSSVMVPKKVISVDGWFSVCCSTWKCKIMVFRLSSLSQINNNLIWPLIFVGNM